MGYILLSPTSSVVSIEHFREYRIMYNITKKMSSKLLLGDICSDLIGIKFPLFILQNVFHHKDKY